MPTPWPLSFERDIGIAKDEIEVKQLTTPPLRLQPFVWGCLSLQMCGGAKLLEEAGSALELSQAFDTRALINLDLG